MALCLTPRLACCPSQDCLALGAIFAATDTVAVLQVIRPEEAGVLYSLVFGEGVMNDATSVALLRVIQVGAPTLTPRPRQGRLVPLSGAPLHPTPASTYICPRPALSTSDYLNQA